MTAKLTVVVGPMFSGKTEYLIQRLNNAEYARKAGALSRVIVLKPAIDTRFDVRFIAAKRVLESGISEVTHSHSAIVVDSREQAEVALESAGEIDLLIIDEAQFLGNWLVSFIAKLLKERAEHNLEIVIGGLDQDAELRPFGPMPALLAIADTVVKLTAVCFMCGETASLTKRIDDTSKKQVQIGDSDKYEARCRRCHKVKGRIIELK